MVDIILYFGSFNPIHRGHTAIAKYLLDGAYCKELIFVVSPQNPFKSQSDLMPEQLRAQMAEIASAKIGSRVSVSDIEFTMPKPSYSIDTILKFRELYPDKTLGLLMGGDNLEGLSKWKSVDKILENCKLFVYPRRGEILASSYDFTPLENAPLLDISSTEIREMLRQGKDCSQLLEPEIKKMLTL